MQLKSEEQCVNTVTAIGMSINEEFLERQILIEMKCEKIGEEV
jgi:hypothetical protein